MLRNILIAIGLIVAINPYLGLPQSIDKIILTGLGLSMVFLLVLSRRGRVHREAKEPVSDNSVTHHIERTEIEDSPLMHVERSIVEDMQSIAENETEDVVVEKKTSVVRRRKIKTNDESFSRGEGTGN